MTDFLVILAHGALGAWDEIIFFGVAAVFVVMMGISWISSRQTEDEDESASSAPSAAAETAATSIAQSDAPQTERFELR